MKKEKTSVSKVVTLMVSLFFWGQMVLFLFRINSFKSMYMDMGGELPFITQMVMNHIVVSVPLLISIVLYFLSYLPSVRKNRLKTGVAVGLSLGITLITLTVCTIGSFAPMFDMINMVN